MAEIEQNQPQSPVEEQPKPPTSRRTVLKAAAVGAAGAAVGVGTTAIVTQITIRKSPPPSKWRFFTDAEASLAQAVCEQIIPADQDPGAKDANVLNFIDKQLVGPYQKHQAAYRTGLASLQSTSQKLHGQPFEQLSWDQQTALLKTLEADQAPKDIWPNQSAKSFFTMMIAHTMQGFYGSPRHGGNKDYASYKMLGLEYPRVIGRNRYSGNT